MERVGGDRVGVGIVNKRKRKQCLESSGVERKQNNERKREGNFAFTMCGNNIL